MSIINKLQPSPVHILLVDGSRQSDKITQWLPTNFTDIGTGSKTLLWASYDASFARQRHRCFRIVLLCVFVLFIDDLPLDVNGFVVGAEQPPDFILDVRLVLILHRTHLHHTQLITTSSEQWFSRWAWVSQYLLEMPASTCSQTEPLALVESGFYKPGVLLVT